MTRQPLRFFAALLVIFIALYGTMALSATDLQVIGGTSNQPATEKSDTAVTQEQPDMANADAEKNSQSEPDAAGPEQQAYPGVTNRLMQKGGDGKPSLSLNYPEFGKKKVDASILEFINQIAAGYDEEVKEDAPEDAEKPESYDMWEMSGFYTLEKPNPDFASIVFNIYSYTGGAHGNLLIRCLNYDLASQQALTFRDIFGDPEKAVQLLSELTAKKLRNDLGDDADEDMIQGGTTPEEANFANITLLPHGIAVEFQPYQVGPWSIGPQHVEISLEELSPARPNPKIWPNASRGGSIPQPAETEKKPDSNGTEAGADK